MENNNIFNLVVCLNERRQFAKQYGGVWIEQVKELEARIKMILEAKTKSRYGYSKYAKTIVEGDTIFSSNNELAVVLNYSDTNKMRKFEVFTINGEYKEIKRNKLTSCCYK